MKRENKEQPNKKKMSKKSIIITSIVSAVVIATGVGVGTFLGKMVFVEEVDHSDINATSLDDNQVVLMQKYQANKDKAPEQLIETFEPYELVNIGLNKIGEHEHAVTIGKGNVVAMGQDQGIRAYTIKDGNDIMCESISAGILKIAKRFYQDSDSVKCYVGSCSSLTSYTFNEDQLKQTYNLQDFENEWGRDYTRPSIYIVSSQTVIEGSSKVNDKGQIEVSLELDPFSSVARYVKQMRMMSDLKKDPNFSKLHIDYVLDKDLNLLENTTTEAYKTYYIGMWVDTVGTVTEKRYYDEDIKIPALSEDCDYR